MERGRKSLRVTYDPEADAAYVHLTDEPISSGRDSVPVDDPYGNHLAVVLDWKDGCLVGIEVLGARRRLHADLLALSQNPSQPD